MTGTQVIPLIRRFVGQFKSQKSAAFELGISPTHLCDMINGRRSPGEAILKRLGLERIVSYRKVRA